MRFIVDVLYVLFLRVALGMSVMEALLLRFIGCLNPCVNPSLFFDVFDRLCFCNCGLACVSSIEFLCFIYLLWLLEISC